jgi:hypothetical protein
MFAFSASSTIGDEQGVVRSMGGSKDPNKLCYQSAAYKPEPRNGDQVSPPSEEFKGAIADNTRPYEEFYKGLLTFQTVMNEVYDVDGNTTIDRSNAENAINEYMREELYGKHIAGWQGWVVETGVMAIEAGSYVLDHSHDYSNAVLLSTSDPFTTAIPSSIKGRDGYDLPMLNDPYVLVVNAREASGQQLCLGQRVSIDGDVTWLPTFSFVYPRITLPTATLTIQEDRIAGDNKAPVMEDAIINYKIISGWTMDVLFEITIYGNGTLFYTGSYFGDVDGYRIANIGESEVQQILAAFQKAGFDSLGDYSDGCCDFGTSYITLTRDGRTKQVAYNGGNTTAPGELSVLEDQLLQLVQVRGWIR